MTEDPNAEILSASEIAVGAAKKELGRTLDYSVNSLNDLETLIQHVKSHFLKLKGDGKLTEQTVQRASISIGGYLGEVIRRSYGGTWIAKNNIMKVLIINNQEFSPIYFIFLRLTKDSNSKIENYLSEINQKLKHPANAESKRSFSEKSNGLMGNSNLLTGGIIGTAILCLIGTLGIFIYSNITKIVPTATRPPATKIYVTPTPIRITREPIHYLQNLPSGYVVNDSINSRDVTLADGTRLFDVALINKQAFNHGDLVSAQYFITIYPSEKKAISEYYKYLISLEGEENGVLDSDIGIEGADDSAMYFSTEENNIAAMQYTSRVNNIVLTTVGLTVYDPQTITDSYLETLMALVAELHILGINNTHR